MHHNLPRVHDGVGVGGVGGGGKRKLEDVKRSVFWSKERLEKLDKVVVKHIQVTQTTMSGGGVENSQEFNRELFSFRRISLAPTVLLIGYGLCIVAIMKKPKQENA